MYCTCTCTAHCEAVLVLMVVLFLSGKGFTLNGLHWFNTMTDIFLYQQV